MDLEHFSAAPTTILEIGDKDRDKDEECRCTPMETPISVNGDRTRGMERDKYCGGQGDNIQGKWRLGGCMVRVR